MDERTRRSAAYSDVLAWVESLKDKEMEGLPYAVFGCGELAYRFAVAASI